MGDRALDRRRLTGTKPFVYIDQRVRIVFRPVLLYYRLLKSVVFTEHLIDFFVGSYAESPYKRRYRHLSVLIDAHIDDIV